MSQIDHVCNNTTFRRTMEHIRAKRGTAIISDCHPVLAKIKPKLEKHYTTEATVLQRFNATLLQDTNKLDEFKTTLAFYNLLEEKETTMRRATVKGLKE